MIKFHFIIILFIFLILKCSSEKTNDENNDQQNKLIELSKLASSKFDSGYNLNYNTPKDFVICKKVNKEEIPGYQLLIFFLFDLKEGEIIFEDRVPNGNIYWQSDHIIKVEEIPGIIRKDVSEPIPGYKYDVNQRKKL